MAVEFSKKESSLIQLNTNPVNPPEPTDDPSTSSVSTPIPEITLTNAECELLKQVRKSQNSSQNEINTLKLQLKTSRTGWQREISHIREK